MPEEKPGNDKMTHRPVVVRRSKPVIEARRLPVPSKSTLVSFLDAMRQDLRQASRARHHAGEDARDIQLRSCRLGILRVHLGQHATTFTSITNIPSAFRAIAVTLEDKSTVVLVRPMDKTALPFWVTATWVKDATGALAFIASPAGPRTPEEVN